MISTRNIYGRIGTSFNCHSMRAPQPNQCPVSVIPPPPPNQATPGPTSERHPARGWNPAARLSLCGQAGRRRVSHESRRLARSVGRAARACAPARAEPPPGRPADGVAAGRGAVIGPVGRRRSALRSGGLVRNTSSFCTAHRRASAAPQTHGLGAQRVQHQPSRPHVDSRAALLASTRPPVSPQAWHNGTGR